MNLKPLARLSIRTSPDRGNYLLENNSVCIPIVLQQTVYEFRVEKNVDLFLGDYRLVIERHDLNSSNLTTTERQFPIWIFWYRPNNEVITQAQHYINKQADTYPVGIIVYMQNSPQQSVSKCHISKASQRLWLCQMASPIEAQGFADTVTFLAKEFIKPLAEAF